MRATRLDRCGWACRASWLPVLPAGTACRCGCSVLASTPAPPVSGAARGRLPAPPCPGPPAFPAIKTINPASSAPRLPGAAHTTPLAQHRTAPTAVPASPVSPPSPASATSPASLPSPAAAASPVAALTPAAHWFPARPAQPQEEGPGTGGWRTCHFIGAGAGTPSSGRPRELSHGFTAGSAPARPASGRVASMPGDGAPPPALGAGGHK